MKRKYGLIGRVVKGLEATLRKVRQCVRLRADRARLMRAFREVDVRGLAAWRPDVPATPFLVLCTGEDEADRRDAARCVDSIKRQWLPAAGVTLIRPPLLEGLRDALTSGEGPMAICLPQAVLCEDATLWIGQAMLGAARWKAVYADHVDGVPSASRHGIHRPHFKPDFSWLYLLARNFVEPFVVYDRAIAAAAVNRLLDRGGHAGTALEVFYALALEALHGLGEQDVLHVQQPLAYLGPVHRGGLPGVACAALAQTGVDAVVSPDPHDPEVHHFVLKRRSTPRVSIIIPTKNAAELVTSCITSLRANAGYDAFDITVIDHASTETELLDYLERESATGGLSVFHWAGAFNFAAMNNAAIRRTEAPLVLLLNNDIDGFSSEWLDQLVATMEIDPAIAAVGCLLTYPDGAIQHAGVVFSAERVGFHGHRDLPNHASGYRGRLRSLQEYSAVTAAFMLVRRSAFDEIGGFDETFPDDYNDLDLCLRLRRAGYRIVYTPAVSAVHWETRTRTSTGTARDVFEARWAAYAAHDPFYSPWFKGKHFVPDGLERLWQARKTVALSKAMGLSEGNDGRR